MRTKKGIVTSAKMTGTVTVTVHAFVFHPIYKKRFRRSKKFLADTNGQDVHEGDLVVITECRPISKRKCFKVTEVVEQAPRVSDIKEEATLEKAVHREKIAPVIEKKEEKKEDEKAEETSASAKATVDKKEEKEVKEEKETEEKVEEPKESDSASDEATLDKEDSPDAK